LTFAPATESRAENREASPRRKAEIAALIARRRAEKQNRARVAAIREAEMARQLTETRAYEISLAQAYAMNQASLERQGLIEAYSLNRMNQYAALQSFYTPFASMACLGYRAHQTGPVFMSFNLGGAPESNHGSNAHAAFHAETAMHHGHGR
jgi:hypothetical protein